MKGVSTTLVKVALPLAGLVVLSLIPAGLLTSRIKTNNTIDAFLAQRDPGLTFYRETTAKFGGDRLVYVSVAPGDVFTVPALQLVDDVTRALADLDGVVRVSSLAATDAIFDEGGFVTLGPLMESVPTTAEEVARVEQKVYGSHLLPWYVSPDRTATLVVAEADPALEPVDLNRTIQSIHGCVEAFSGNDVHFALAGNPVVAEAIDRLNARDQKLFSGLMLLLVLVSSALWQRRLSSALLPVAVVLVTVIWVTGLFVWAGHQTNWITAIISPILFLIGVATSVHFLAMYEDALVTARTRQDAIVRALRIVALPCLFTSVTTAVGFASLMANQIKPVRVFGLYAAIGVMLALVATMILLPAGLSLGGRRGTRRVVRASKPWRLLARLDQLVQRWPKIVLAVSGAFSLALAAGVVFINVETNMLRLFEPSAPVVRHSLEIEQVYGGSAPLDIVLDTGRDSGALDPAFLVSLIGLQDRLEAIPGISRGISLGDLVQDLHQAMAGDQIVSELPNSDLAVEQLLLLPDPDMLDLIVDSRRRTTRITTRFAGAGMGLKQARVLLGEVEAAAADMASGSDTNVRLTGSSVLFVNLDSYLVQGQIRSLGIVLVLVLVIMSGLFRSVRMGLLAMIPNVLPIAMMLGMMGWLGMPLDALSVMIGCFAIGIGVDDTIHYLVHLRRELAGENDLRGAMTRTITAVGRPIVFTSVVLTLGLWSFAASDFVGTRNFGLLSGFTVVVALVADLLVLPATILVLGVPRGWASRRPRGSAPVR